MNITCSRSELYENLFKVQKANSTNSHLANLDGVLIKAKEGELSFCCYNMEMGITCKMPATVYKEGEIILKTKLFVDIAKKLPEDTVAIKAGKNLKTTIECGNSKFTLIGAEAADFPELPVMDEFDEISLPAEKLKKMVKQTIFAAATSTEISNPVYSGILIELSDDNISLVSSDGFRLAVKNEKIENKDDRYLKLIIPARSLFELTNLVTDDEEEIKLRFSQNHVEFTLKDTRIISNLIEGQFLDYKSTINAQAKVKAQIKTKELIESIERVSSLIVDKLRSSIKLKFEDESVKIQCETTAGEALDQVSAVLSNNELLVIGLNNKFILEALKNTGAEEVIMEFNTALTPVKILPKEGDDFVFVVLPIRLKNI